MNLSDLVSRTITIASSLSQFHLLPKHLSEIRKRFIYENFDVVSIPVKALEISSWRCRVSAKVRIPCLPSGIGRIGNFIMSDVPIEAYEGVLYFEGKVLPKTTRLLYTGAIAVPRDFKHMLIKASIEGELYVELEVSVENSYKPLLVKEGDDVCILTYYESLWYGFSHSATTIALLSLYRNTKRTIVFAPRFYLLEDIPLDNCSQVYVVDGLGVAKSSFERVGGTTVIGGSSEWFGSPFDTPDKFRALRFLQQWELLDALLK